MGSGASEPDPNEPYNISSEILWDVVDESLHLVVPKVRLLSLETLRECKAFPRCPVS